MAIESIEAPEATPWAIWEPIWSMVEDAMPFRVNPRPESTASRPGSEIVAAAPAQPGVQSPHAVSCIEAGSADWAGAVRVVGPGICPPLQHLHAAVTSRNGNVRPIRGLRLLRLSYAKWSGHDTRGLRCSGGQD